MHRELRKEDEAFDTIYLYIQNAGLIAMRGFDDFHKSCRLVTNHMAKRVGSNVQRRIDTSKN